MDIKYFKSLICLLALAFHCSLCAEIETVTLRWTPGFCNQGCNQLLAQFLAAMPGVAEVNINQQGGQALLRWRPNFPFSLTQLSNTVARVGVFMEEIRVKVRGTVRRQGQTLLLVSIGDNTPFVLIGPLQTIPGRAVDQFSLQNYPLTPFLISQLTLAVQDSRVTIVEGPLNFWSGTQTQYLSIQQLHFVLPTSQ